MNLLLDTNILSEIRKIPQRGADRAVLAWWRTIAEEDVFLPAPALAELVKGIALLRAEGGRGHEERAMRLDAWLSELRTTYRDRTVRLDDDVVDEWGHLMAAHRGEAGAIDLLVAAMAIARRMTLATRDADFRRIAAKSSLAIVNPFEFRVPPPRKRNRR